VFFVISGFLITGLILQDIEQGSFSLANFWARRIRRIVPAMTVMITVILILGIVTFLPSDLTRLAKSIIAQQVLISNIYFYRNTGYFDGPSELMPLLHTWSLSVEEQFYLIYPIVLAWSSRAGRKIPGILLWIGIVLSFALSCYELKHSPAAAFYLLPYRAWELLLGGVLWFLPYPSGIHGIVREAISCSSILTIIVASCVFSKSTPFPGIYALVPCMATTAFIYINSDKVSYTGLVLSCKPIVFIGLTSYSLYLWHWPLLVVIKYLSVDNVSRSILVVWLVVTVFVSIASWRFIEQPFRNAPKSFGLRSLAAMWFGSIAILVGSCGIVWRTRGLAVVYPPSVLAIDAVTVDPSIFKYETSYVSLREGRIPSLGNSEPGGGRLDFVLWGDSHALSLGAFLEEFSRRWNLRGAIVARRATPPLPDCCEFSSEKRSWSKSALDHILRAKPRHVILAARWNSYFKEVSEDKERALSSVVARLTDHGIRVWILLQAPEQDFSVPQAMWVNRRFGVAIPPTMSLWEYHLERAGFCKALNSLEVAATALDPISACFDESGFSVIGGEDGAYYRDEHHVSKLGAARLFGRVFEQWRRAAFPEMCSPIVIEQ